MKYTTLLLFLFIPFFGFAQVFSGRVFMKESAETYLNQVYVTNLATGKTTLTAFDGSFRIEAAPGNQIRFTSFISERKDFQLSDKSFTTHNLIELKPLYRNIPEVVIKAKPTGILKKDVLALKAQEKPLKVAEIIGLPEPIGDGYSPSIPAASFKDGGMAFSIDAIYAALSGDKQRNDRLKKYEIMNNQINNIKNYFGTDYFVKLKIPTNLIDNFLQFVYSSDNLNPYLASNNFEAVKPYLEKYLPVYLKRLENSHLTANLN